MGSKIEREVKEALKQTGLPFDIQISGSCHKQIVLAGKKIGVICITDKKRHDANQILAKIRQRVKELG